MTKLIIYCVFCILMLNGINKESNFKMIVTDYRINNDKSPDSIVLYLEDVFIIEDTNNQIQVQITNEFKLNQLREINFFDCFAYDKDSNLHIGGNLKIYYKDYPFVTIGAMDSLSSEMPINFYFFTSKDKIVFSSDKIVINKSLSSRYANLKILWWDGFREFLVQNNKYGTVAKD